MNTDKRTDDEINKVIAEWCGYIEIYQPEIYEYKYKDPNGSYTNTLPNYCRDLNAMHEAEKKLTDDQFEYYGPILGGVTKAQSRRALVSAEARQRAEALVTLIEDPLLNK